MKSIGLRYVMLFSHAVGVIESKPITRMSVVADSGCLLTYSAQCIGNRRSGL